jgi:DNA-directed RNA polymerase specialized sigma24 family protein
MQQPAEERFQEIYARHHAAVAAYARRRVAADVADDVVAETFLVCWPVAFADEIGALFGFATEGFRSRRAGRLSPGIRA